MEKALLKSMRTRFFINWFLIGVLLLAFFLRLYKIATIPPHLTPDEAALGYNAYSILKTGKDEYGQTLPIIFKSFGDYKPGLYIYLTVPFVAIFGLNEFAVRLPSALMGVLGVGLIYLLVKELFGSKRLAFFASFLLAISPWHIHFSRGAWEINFALSLTLIGIYFFLKSLQKQKFLIFSSVFFALTLLTYQGAKLASAIVVLILVSVYWRELLRFNKKVLLKSFFLGLVVSVPIILIFFECKNGRLKVFSVFSYRRPAEYLQAQLDQGNEKVGELGYYLFHSETFNMVRGIMGRWFNHFSAKFFFFVGDWQNPRHSAPNQGMLLLGDSALILLGIVWLIKALNRKEAKFVGLWLLLAPLPAALSRDQVHAVRAFNLVIPLTIILALGLSWLAKHLKNKVFISCFVLLYFAGFVYFLDAYFVHLPVHDSLYWEYGYKQAVEIVIPIQDKYEKVHVRQSYAQPYVYFLFFQNYDPVKYQKQAHLIESEYGDVGRVEKIDNIYFLPIDWTVNRGDSRTLFVADPIRIPPEDSSDPKEFEVIAEIKYLDGRTTALRVLGVK
jgi:4-amino-4-deoxy-L-arabinose transferase-like glycosyltransferase